MFFYDGCTLDEIRAFRKLESEVFDFGKGRMRMDGWYGSEDAYYEMCLPEECGYIEYKTYKKPKKSKKKVRLNKYARKQIDKRKLNKLHTITWWGVWNKGKYKKRCYLSRRRKWAKRRTNTKIRNYKGYIRNGGEYRKYHEYWWEIW